MADPSVYSIAGAYQSIIRADPSLPEFREAIRNPETAIAARALGKEYYGAAVGAGNNRHALDAKICSALKEMNVDSSGAAIFLQQAFDMYSQKGNTRQIKSKAVLRAFKNRMMGKPMPVVPENAIYEAQPEPVEEDAEEISPEEALRLLSAGKPQPYMPPDSLPHDLKTPRDGQSPAIRNATEESVEIYSSDELGSAPYKAAQEEEEAPKKFPRSRRMQKPKKMGIVKKAFIGWSIVNTLWLAAAASHLYIPESRKYFGSETLGIVGKGIEATSGFLENIVNSVIK